MIRNYKYLFEGMTIFCFWLVSHLLLHSFNAGNGGYLDVKIVTGIVMFVGILPIAYSRHGGLKSFRMIYVH